MKFYTKAKEKQLLEMKKKCREEGKSTKDTAVILNSLNLLTANDQQWTQNRLSCFMSVRRRKLNNREKPSKPEGTHGIPRPVAEALLTDPTLTDKQRVGMLTAYLQNS